MYNMFIMLLPEHRKILKVSTNTGQQGYMANNFWNICIILSFFMYSLWASDTLKVGSSSQEWMNDWLTGWFEWNGKNSKFFPQFEQVKPDNFALSDNWADRQQLFQKWQVQFTRVDWEKSPTQSGGYIQTISDSKASF